MLNQEGLEQQQALLLLAQVLLLAVLV